MSDAILLAHIGKIAEQVPKDLPKIEAAIPIINQAFVDQLIADYQTALGEGGDDVARSKVGQKTQTLLDAMSASQSIIRKLRFWVDEAFEGNPAMKKSFHLSKFWKIANSQPHLIKYMNSLATTVNSHRAELIAAGAPEVFVDSVAANAQELASADAVQESSKGGRSNATQERIKALNSLYKRGLKLDKATDIAFEDDPVKAGFYNMPQSSPKADEMDDHEPEM